ncbi:phosphotransferase enzyme family protein [Annulohypoxylon truncatum]|uniref:phosphotransferase enzyme family protein n=1 Tax=Annulohypoxylon truncatum TaxID=327061 RepID=UPI002008C84B|nr:phosphotransferase enzyme family protein [Annulohypoxylon truncatum]KAI1208305.1 phosphotransferase enzyme family protein [Annulohypoxylon truncatum]
MAGKVRHPIDTAALERYISENVPEIKVPLDVKQFGFGQSNPTYQLTSPTGSKYVLRKKPAGELLSKAAHKVEREYRVISALGSSPVPVPRAYALCEDPSVLGTPFYLMSFVSGRIFEDAAMPSASSPSERTALWKAAVEAIASLHRVDPDAVGLGSFGKRTGFYDRQLATWSQICAAQARTRDVDTGAPVGEIPHMAELMSFFGDATLRPADRATLVHGDYKIDNVVFAADEPRVAGILDWELSAIGHPLSDLANLLHPYVSASMSTSTSTSSSSAASENKKAAVSAVSHPGFLPGATPGLPTPSQILAWYAAAAGWTPSAEDVAWASAFSVFRLAAICQGIAARVARRQASSAEAQKHAAAMPLLGEFAWDLVRREQGKGKARGVGGAKL